MILDAALGLIHNAAILLSLGVLYVLSPVGSDERSIGWKLGEGISIGLMGIALLLTRWELLPGLIFDTRTVLLVVSGLYFGLIPAAVGTGMVSAFRLFQGGVGALSGVVGILISVAMGLLWRRYLPGRTGWLDLFILGFITHVLMFLSAFLMPLETALETLRHIAPPGIAVYTGATMVLGRLLDLQRQRRTTTQEIQRNSRRLEGMLKADWGIVALLDAGGRFAYASPPVSSVLGYTLEEVQGKEFGEFVHPEDSPAIREEFRRLLSKPGHTTRAELRIRHGDGHWVWAESIARNLLDDPDLQAVVVNTRDITSNRTAMKALAESEETYRTLLQSIPDIVIRFDAEGRHLFASTNVEQLTGLPPEALRGKTHRDLGLPEADCEFWETQIQEVFRTGEPLQAEISLQSPAGPVLFDCRLMPELGAGGQVRSVLAVNRDVSEARAAEAALESQRVRLANVIEGTEVGTWEWNVQTGETVFDERWAAMVGYTLEELEPTSLETWSSLVHPDDMGRSTRILQEHFEGLREAYVTQFRMKHKAGHWVWVMDRGKVIEWTEDGRPLRMFGTHTDITDQVKAEQALTEERALLRQITENSPVGISVSDPEGRYRFLNRQAEMILGISSKEATGRSIYDLGFRLFDSFGKELSGDRSLTRMIREAKGPITDRELQFILPNGRKIELRINAGPLLDPDGEVRDVVAIFEDITQQVADQKRRAQAEAELQQAQKLEAIGRLAGGVAHDFNNMLAVIMSATEMALPEVKEGTNLYEDLQHISQAAERSAELTRQLLAFSRKQVINPRVLDLNEIIRVQERMLQRLIGEDVGIELGLRDDLWKVRMDPSQVDQILANLIVNARDAIPGVGTVTIDTDNVALGPEYGRADMPIQEGPFVLLSVTDTGSGMDRATLDQIFDPFFTTKRKGQGTGLGLSTVYGIVKQANGVIHVYSEPGMGTTFKIYLPRFEGDAEPSTRREGRSLRGTETVLVVEDEASILSLARRFLEEYGYTVMTALTPMEAIGLVHEHPGPIHLLLTDVVMPGMNGKQLQSRIADLRPGVRTLFMSGYTANVIAQRGVLEKDVEFIQKPFTMTTLLHRVREVLEGDRA